MKIIKIDVASQGVGLSASSEQVGITVGGAAAGGTSDHRELSNRDAPDQHPMSAITGLPNSLPASLTNMDILAILNS